MVIRDLDYLPDSLDFGHNGCPPTKCSKIVLWYKICSHESHVYLRFEPSTFVQTSLTIAFMVLESWSTVVQSADQDILFLADKAAILSAGVISCQSGFAISCVRCEGAISKIDRI